MTMEGLKQFLEAHPFRPLTMYLADSRTIHVQHPDFVARSPSARTVVVYESGDTFQLVDLLLVSSIETKGIRGRRDTNGRHRPQK